MEQSCCQTFGAGPAMGFSGKKASRNSDLARRAGVAPMPGRNVARSRSVLGLLFPTSARSLSGRIESIWETPSTERGAMFYVRAFARRSLQLSLQSLRRSRSSLLRAAHIDPMLRHPCFKTIQICLKNGKATLPRHLPGIGATPARRVIRITCFNVHKVDIKSYRFPGYLLAQRGGFDTAGVWLQRNNP